MNKKILFSVLLAVLVALGVASTAFAAEGQPPEGRGGRRGVGLVTAVAEEQITVQSPQGETYTLLVDENTRYHFPDGGEASFADVQVGRWIAGTLQRNEEDAWIARHILILPEGFDPSLVTQRARGQVTAVDAAGGTLSIETRRGETLTFTVDGNTLFIGPVQGLEAVAVGMVAGVGAQELDGALVAVVMHAHLPVIRHAGKVTAVDAAGGSFSIQTREGERLTFSVDEETRFHSRDGAVESLEDLQVGMVAGVGAHQLEDGTYLAVNVGAANPEDLPDLRVRGEVVAVGENSFTIQTLRGEELTLVVNEETIFRSRDGSVTSLADLEAGMRLRAAVQDLGEEGLLAMAVFVR